MSHKPQLPPIRAGMAYLEATKNDAQARKAWVKLRALAEGITWISSPLGDLLATLATPLGTLTKWLPPELAKQFQEKIRQLEEEVRQGVEEVKAELADRGFEIPWERIDAWERLARLVEKDPGPLTLQEIYQWAIAWADRETYRLRLAKKLDAERPRAQRPTAADLQDLIRKDQYDPAIAWVNGKRVYLGYGTVTYKLFWFFVQTLGRKWSLSTLMRIIDGYETFPDMGEDEYRKARQRLRWALTRLRQRLSENDADDELTIHRLGTHARPAYMMIYNRWFSRGN